MLHKSVVREELVQCFHGPSQVMSRTGENQEIIHKPGIAQMRLLFKVPVSFRQMKGRQKGTQSGGAGNAFAWRVKMATVLDRVMQELRQQVKVYRVIDVLTELGEQQSVLDIRIIPSDVGAADERVSFLLDHVLCPPDALLSPTMTPDVLTTGRDRQQRRDAQGECSEHHGIGC